MADKLGSFTRVIIMALVGDALFFTLILAVPPLNWVSESTLSDAAVNFSQTDDGLLRFEAHKPAWGKELPQYISQSESVSDTVNKIVSSEMKLRIELLLQVDLSIQFEECRRPIDGCPDESYFHGFCDAMSRDPSRGFCGNGTMRFEAVQVSDFLHTCETISGIIDVKGFGTDCEFECRLVEESIKGNKIGKCERMEGNRRLTIGERLRQWQYVISNWMQ